MRSEVGVFLKWENVILSFSRLRFVSASELRTDRQECKDEKKVGGRMIGGVREKLNRWREMIVGEISSHIITSHCLNEERVRGCWQMANSE
jgi:hypothetical protein